MTIGCGMNRAAALLEQIKHNLSEREMRWLMERLTIYLAVSTPSRIAAFNRPEINLAGGKKKESA